MTFQNDLRKVVLSFIYPFCLIFISSTSFVFSQDTPLAQRGAQEGFGNLESVVQYGHLVLTSQPDRETFRMIKEQGITMVINIRGEAENEGFDERKAAAQEGLAYLQIPYMDGRFIQESAIEELLGLIRSTENNGTKVMIHCSHSQRTGSLLGVALVKSGYSREGAVKIATDAGMTSRFMTKIHNEFLDRLSE